MKPGAATRAAIDHCEVYPVPYSLGFDDGTDSILDEHYGSTEWRQRMVPYMTTVGSVDTQGYRPYDPIRQIDAYGAIWRMDRRPWHLETPPLSKPDLSGYQLPEYKTHFYDPKLPETARREAAAHPDSYHVLGMGWGIFEMSWRIRGFEEALMDMAVNPEFMTELLEGITDIYLQHVAQCEGLPGDAMLFGDDWGDQRGVIMGPKRWRQFIKPCWARVWQAVHAQGRTVMCHSCGSVADIIPDLIEIGLDVLESVQPEPAGMNPYELKRQFGEDITFFGCLGSQSTIQFSSPEGIRAEVNKLCREMGRGGGYILHPAKSIQPGTPPENVVAVFESFVDQDTLG